MEQSSIRNVVYQDDVLKILTPEQYLGISNWDSSKSKNTLYVSKKRSYRSSNPRYHLVGALTFKWTQRNTFEGYRLRSLNENMSIRDTTID